MRTRSRRLCGLAVLLTAVAFTDLTPGVRSANGTSPLPGRERILDLPLAFEENRGQVDASVRFVARGPGYTVRLGEADAVVRLSGGRNPIRMSFAGGARSARVVAGGRARAVSHYLIGNDPARWRTNVARYASVRYQQVYPGIDVVYYGNQRQLEYDFEVAPGADPRQIAVDFTGTPDLRVDAAGDLVLDGADAALRLYKPIAYQHGEHGRSPVEARFALDEDGRVRFALGEYDRTRSLVIDPILGYSTYGGGAAADYAFGIAVDGSGNAYVTGATDSFDFPTTPGAFDGTYGGTTGVPPRGDAFVMKLDPAGALVYATYVGGSNLDRAHAIAVDASGNAYITGRTISTDFPTTPGAVQPAWGNSPFSSNGDMFVTKLNASGSALVYSTYLGGASLTTGYGIAVDAAGSAFVVGEASFTFRTPNPLVQQPTSAFSDAFVAKLAPSGGSLMYATLLGGNDLEEAYGVAVDGSGNAFVMGRTSSSNFPTQSAAQPTYGGGQDIFVTRLDAAGAKVYSTFLGGNGFESAGGGIAIDSGGNAYVTGFTDSANFPVTAGALRTTPAGFGDAFVTKFTPSGAFAYSTYLGGSLGDSAQGIAVTSDGYAFVVGTTQSSNFPTTAPIQPAIGSVGTKDMFVTELNPSGSAIVFSTFLGGTGLEEAAAIAVDSSLNVYIAGRTQSTNFPTQSPFQPSNNGGSSEIAIAKIRTVLPVMSIDRNALSFSAVTSGGTTVSSTGAQAVRLTQAGTGTVTWSAVPSVPWLAISPGSGSGSATLNVSLAPGATLPSPGTYPANIALTFTGAGTAPSSITISLTVITNGTSAPPGGSFDTPLDGTNGVTGSIPVTGWAIDDVEVTRVRILRDPVAPEPAGLVYIGDAVLVDGARPDVAAQFPSAPRNTRAGWGYLMLTNFLPNLGTGTFRLHAVADDADGHSTLLGSRTITCSNGSATTPFGAIDTPGQGQSVTGTVTNFGWVLSPGSRRADPTSGGIVNVFVDGVAVGSPGGWTSRPDLTALFPAAQFSGVGNALGVFSFDSTALTNGVHTIAWGVTDNTGGAAGVGSRYFTVSNGASSQLSAVSSQLSVNSSQRSALRAEPSAVLVGRRGFDLDAPLQAYRPGADGRITIQSEELDRIELHAGEGVAGYARAGGTLKKLPIGANLDRVAGIFTWQPGVGFLGAHDFVLGAYDVRIVLNPRGTNRVGPQVTIDTAGDATLAGWAVDLDSQTGTGVETIHVWAYPVAARGAATPVFIGVAEYGGARPDVAAIYGERFLKSGYGLSVRGLPAGEDHLAVFAFSSVRGGFVPARAIRVTVE